MNDPEKKFENIEDFLNDIDPDNDPTPDVDPDPTPDVDPEPNPNPDPDPNPDGTPDDEEKKVKAPAAKAPKKADPNVPNPMRDLRDKANTATKLQEKIDGAINRLSDGDYDFKLRDFKTEAGKVDYDALIAAMDEADVKKRAEGRGLTPEMQAELERYEKEKKEVEIQKARVQMDRQLNNFQMEQQLTPEDLNTFISDAMKQGINPLSIAALDRTSKGTMALKLLYKAIYSERITKEAIDKAVAAAEEKWNAAAEAKKGPPKSNPGNPNNGKTDKPNSKGLALDEFLNSLK